VKNNSVSIVQINRKKEEETNAQKRENKKLRNMWEKMSNFMSIDVNKYVS